MNNAELFAALYNGENVLCANGTIYRHNDDDNTLEFLPESSIKAGSSTFKRKGKGNALSNPVRTVTDTEIAQMVRPKTVAVPVSELDALRQRINELENSGN